MPKGEHLRGQPKHPHANNGRPFGSVNKITQDLRIMIREALDAKGGIEYLKRQADENPVAFMGLVSKCLPSNPAPGTLDNPLHIQHSVVNKLDISGMSVSQLDALEIVLRQTKMLTIDGKVESED